MPNFNIVEEGTIAARVYEDGKHYLGIAEIEMPKVDRERFTVKGLDLMGSAEFPAKSQVKPMTMNIKFRDANDAQYVLAEQRMHLLTLWVHKQGHDDNQGNLVEINHKYIMQVQPLVTGGGTIAPATPQESSDEFAVYMLKEFRNNELVRHIDVINYIFKDSSGIDRAASIRRGLGME